MDMTMDSIRVPAAVIRVAMMMMSTTPGMRIWQKNFCIHYGLLCQQLNMTIPGCPTGPARDLVLDECDMPFLFGDTTK
jgi:hypothetical protein